MSKYWMVVKDNGDTRLFYLRCEAEEYLIEVLKNSEYAHRKYSNYVDETIAKGNDTEGFYDYLALLVKAHRDETTYDVCWTTVQEIPVCMSVEAALEADKAESEIEIEDMGE